jgi:probable HAF family extracellular repeat protein
MSIRAGEPQVAGYSMAELPGFGGSVAATAVYTSEDEGVFNACGSGAVASGDTHAILWQNGMPIDLGTLGGTTSAATGMYPDPAGFTVVGVSQIADGSFRAFLWRNGAMSELMPNPYGQVTRAYGATGGNVPGGVFTATGGLEAGAWSGGAWTPFPPLRMSGAAEAFASSGAAYTGYASTDASPRHACLWTGGPGTDLGSLGAAALQSEGLDVNGWGLTPVQVVGKAFNDNGEQRAFFWQDGMMRDLGTLGGTSAIAYGVDALGNVVGRAASASAIRAAIWPEGGAAVDLNTRLLVNPSAVALVDARDIDNRGYIVGNGSSRAFLLSPVYATGPFVRSVSPGSGLQGATMNVTLGGSRFIPGATVDFGPGITVNRATVSSIRPFDEHLLTANITISSTAPLGARAIEVTNPGGLRHVFLGGFAVEPGVVVPALETFTLTPNPATGGSRLMGNVTLTAPAGAGGLKVKFKSSTKSQDPPKKIVVPEGATTLAQPFVYKTSKVKKQKMITITARGGGVSRAVMLLLLPRP